MTAPVIFPNCCVKRCRPFKIAPIPRRMSTRRKASCPSVLQSSNRLIQRTMHGDNYVETHPDRRAITGRPPLAPCKLYSDNQRGIKRWYPFVAGKISGIGNDPRLTQNVVHAAAQMTMHPQLRRGVGHKTVKI